MLVLFVIFITLVLLVYLLSMMWPPDSPWSPWWRTSTKTARIMCKMAHITKNDVIYDLGSGEGIALTIAAKEFGAKGVGVEIDPFRAWSSKLSMKLKGLSSKVRIVRKNFFDVDISDATVIFIYLVPKAMNELKPKFFKELKPGTRLVSFVYKVDLPMIASDVKNKVYVYEIPQERKTQSSRRKTIMKK